MNEDSFVQYISILAIILGPIAAVLIGKYLQDRDRKYHRKLSTFRDIMKTRNMGLSADHVLSLNLIQIDFYDNKKVLDSYARYMENLSTPLPKSDEDIDKFIEIRRSLFYQLLKDMGDDLGYYFDKDDLKRLAYTPKGWADQENIYQMNLILLNEILKGERPMPVILVQPMPAKTLFPPPPNNK